ncbi:MAG: hypothetical protein VX007_07085, partial [Pseudomonadota bacterium]|nr:hypothetical protein [Pseudomonadota bacterium]
RGFCSGVCVFSSPFRSRVKSAILLNNHSLKLYDILFYGLYLFVNNRRNAALQSPKVSSVASLTQGSAEL